MLSFLNTSTIFFSDTSSLFGGKCHPCFFPIFIIINWQFSEKLMMQLYTRQQHRIQRWYKWHHNSSTLLDIDILNVTVFPNYWLSGPNNLQAECWDHLRMVFFLSTIADIFSAFIYCRVRQVDYLKTKDKGMKKHGNIAQRPILIIKCKDKDYL